MKIAPSMLASKPENYVEDVKTLEKANVEWFHIDMLDGTFTNTHAFPVEHLKIINDVSDFPMDIHLMTNHPIESLPEYIDAGGDMLTAHVEAVNPRKYIDAVKKYDKMVGLAINPDTPLSSIVDYIGELDRILIMTVVPGKTGQSFIEAPLSKVREARTIIDKHNYNVELCVDGGINEKTAALAVDAGVDVVVSGAGILYKDDMIKAVEELRLLASE
ncbi:MAG: ribulose-phosphate 3-epimerase [Thaumarchaeota archaeon]|nr:ribulose-phosphate 3-epimerase [Nitrososphaerota archaeon]|tara:strand:- start:519 stop:1169 length:651 start_codon:yes stop_codon:yes gene_type:complete